MKKSFLIFTFLLPSLSNYAQIDFPLLWTQGSSGISLIEFSPDGNNVLSCNYGTPTLKVYDANTGGQVWAKPNMFNGTFSPDGSKVVAASTNSLSYLCVYNRYTGALIWQDSLPSIADYHFIISPNSNFIIVNLAAGGAALINLNNGNVIWTKNICFTKNISYDNTKFSYENSDSVFIADLTTGNPIWGIPKYSPLYPQLDCSGFSPDNNFFAISTNFGIQIFNSNTGALTSTIPDEFCFIKYSADNLKLFSYNYGGSGPNELIVYNVATQLQSCIVTNNTFLYGGPLTHELFVFDSLSNLFASSRTDASRGFGVFNTNNGLLIGSDNVAQQFSTQPNPIQIYFLALSPDGTKVFTSEAAYLKMWSTGISGITNNASSNSSYKIYPIPVTKNLSIEIMNESKVERIELFDLQGKLLSTQNSEGNKFSLDVKSLISGTYLLKLVYDDGKVDFEKIIKE